MSATKKGFSSKEIQRQLGIKRYEPVWAMVHKLRKAMSQRDDRYTLEGMIEMNEGYFTIEASEQTTKETLKWVHIAISNAKRNFVGTYHKIKAKYLQLYLNEFVYKLNKRYFGEKLFDRLVIASITAF